MKRSFLAASAALLIVACGKQLAAGAGKVSNEALPVAATAASPVAAVAPAVPSSPAFANGG